jgi:hypothetical protein
VSGDGIGHANDVFKLGLLLFGYGRWHTNADYIQVFNLGMVISCREGYILVGDIIYVRLLICDRLYSPLSNVKAYYIKASPGERYR